MNKKTFIIIGIIITALVAGIILLSGNDVSITEVDGYKARQIMKNNSDNYAFIDVRTIEEHQQNGIEGSTVLPYDQFKSVIENYYPDKEIHIILYCNTGRRSGIAANTLKSLGYKNIYDMGSYKNW